MRYFFAADIPQIGERLTLERDEAHHLFGTLRAREGDEIGVLNGNGVAAVAQVENAKEHTLIISSRTIFAPPPRRVHLYTAAPRRKELDLLLKQCAETGAGSVHLVECARSVALPDANAMARWQGIILEGCKQAHNFFAPQMLEAVKLTEAVADAKASGYRLLFGKVAAAPLPQLSAAGDIALFIGPEGGFTPDEEAFLAAEGATAWHFARNVLRLETAAVGGILLLNYLMGETI